MNLCALTVAYSNVCEDKRGDPRPNNALDLTAGRREALVVTSDSAAGDPLQVNTRR